MVLLKLGYIQFCSSLRVLTILGLARAIVWLRQIALHTGTGVATISVGTRLTASPIQTALIKI